MSSANHDDSTAERSNLIQREILQLLLLIAVAVAAFFVTRAIAANNRDMNRRDAAEWYQRGLGQLDAGDADSAIDSFRRATVKHRSEKRYVLALARALAGTRQDEAASSALLGIQPKFRQSPPMTPRSISTTSAPSCAAPAATASPPAPAPITHKSGVS